MRRTVLLLLAGFLLMGSAAPQEYIEHRVVWPRAWIGLRLGLEEGAELFGFFLCFAALVPRRRRSAGIPAVIPGRAGLPRPGALLSLALTLQLAVSFIVVRFIHIGPRGNPAAWLPAACFLLLAALAYGHAASAPKSERPFWAVGALLGLFLSVTLVYWQPFQQTLTLGRFNLLLQFPFIALASLGVLLLMLLRFRPPLTPIHRLLLIGAGGSVAFTFLDAAFWTYIALGVFALLLLLLCFLPATARAGVVLPVRNRSHVA
jgi:hypothetical protein